MLPRSDFTQSKDANALTSQMPPTRPTPTAHAVDHLRLNLPTMELMETELTLTVPMELPVTIPTELNPTTTLKVEAATHPIAPTKLAYALMSLLTVQQTPPSLSATAQIRPMLPVET